VRGSQNGGVFGFLINFDQPWTPIQCAQILDQTFFENEVISRVDKALDWPSSMSGTKVMAQKPHFTTKIRKCMSLPLGAVARDNWLLDNANELFEPSKDSWSLVCSEKKHLRLGCWVFGGWRQKKGRFGFFGCSIMTSSPGQWARIVAQSLVVF